MTLAEILRTAINPALELLPKKMDSAEAKVMMLAAGRQESHFLYKFQKVRGKPYAKGPAKGYWQNERGGVFCVMTNPATRSHAEAVCKARGVPFDQILIHERLEFDDVLAAAFARLLLWADPRPLPGLQASHEEAWQCYLRCWNPGKPRRDEWDDNHKAALAEVS